MSALRDKSTSQTPQAMGAIVGESHARLILSQVAEIGRLRGKAIHARALTARYGWGFGKALAGRPLRNCGARRSVPLLILLGGGKTRRNVRVRFLHVIDEAHRRDDGKVGSANRDGGRRAIQADIAINIPTEGKRLVTPHAKWMPRVICHLLRRPALQKMATKW